MADAKPAVPKDGAKITLANGKLTVPDRPIMPFIEGDGTGRDIWRASVRVLDAAVEKAYRGKRKIHWMEVYAGEKAFTKFNNWLPDETVAGFREKEFPKEFKKIRFPGSAGIGIKAVSREGTERLVRAAIEFALKNKRKSVTIVHKGNIMKYTEGAFRNWGYALAEREFADKVYTWDQWERTKAQKGEEAANAEQKAALQGGKRSE